MGLCPLRRFTCFLLLLALAISPAVLGGCSRGPKPQTSESIEPPDGQNRSVAPEHPTGPFVTWNQDSTIPFLCYVPGRSGAENTLACLGLWDLGTGTLAFEGSPLFSMERCSGFATWDGESRFAFNHEDFTVLDPRIRIDCVDTRSVESGSVLDGCLVAPSGTGAVYAACLDEGKPVLIYGDTRSARKMVLDAPPLPKGTVIARAIGFEIPKGSSGIRFEGVEWVDNRVFAYFETQRWGRSISGPD